VHRNVSFGVNAGTPADRVPEECDALSERLEGFIRQLDEYRGRSGAVDLGEEVLKVASYTHCELIRIHPFVNGNVRVASTTINYFAWRYGYLPVPFERPKGEYLDALRAWLRYRKIEPFMGHLRPSWERRPGYTA
jgi:Fic family protein